VNPAGIRGQKKHARCSLVSPTWCGKEENRDRSAAGKRKFENFSVSRRFFRTGENAARILAWGGAETNHLSLMMPVTRDPRNKRDPGLLLGQNFAEIPLEPGARSGAGSTGRTYCGCGTGRGKIAIIRGEKCRADGPGVPNALPSDPERMSLPKIPASGRPGILLPMTGLNDKGDHSAGGPNRGEQGRGPEAGAARAGPTPACSKNKQSAGVNHRRRSAFARRGLRIRREQRRSGPSVAFPPNDGRLRACCRWPLRGGA